MEINVKCVVCDKPVYTGISMDTDSFDGSNTLSGEIECNGCGNTISWNNEDILFED